MTNDDRFDYLDINGNGFVDRNEWDGGYSVFAPAGCQPGSAG